MTTHNLTFAKYIEHCKLNKIPIPSWLTGSHFLAVSKLYVADKRYEACRYLHELSRKFVTNPPFDLKWSKTQVVDVFDRFRVAEDLKLKTISPYLINTVKAKPLDARTVVNAVKKREEHQKNFDKLCRGINWKKMAKARQSVKALRNKKTAFDYLSKFLDELADVATETHRVPQNVVHPSAANAKLVTNSLKHKN